jgi:hypothetical protein
MPTQAIIVGITPVPVAIGLEGPDEWIDIIVQNLSANNVYVISSGEGTVADGLRIVANGNHTNDHRGESVWLIADGAASDVRVHYVKYIDTTRFRV